MQLPRLQLALLLRPELPQPAPSFDAEHSFTTPKDFNGLVSEAQGVIDCINPVGT